MGKRGPARNTLRELAMVAAYRSGRTLVDIGLEYGLTRERVRQLIGRHGINSAHGGQTMRALSAVRSQAEKQLAAAERAERRVREKLDISVAEYKALRDKFAPASRPASPIYKFRQQRNNAARRGVEWALTFNEWWRIWTESGLWSQRGRGSGYCMARYGDSGPYSADNVYICTIGQNFSDSYLVDTAKRKKATHVRVISYQTKRGQRYCVYWRGGDHGVGRFETRASAESFGKSMIEQRSA